MSAEASSHDIVRKLSRASGDLETRLLFRSSFLMSMVQAALVAAAAAFFIQWWALAWFAVMAALVFFSSGSHRNNVPEGIAGAFAIAGGSALYALPWGAAWIIGGPQAAFLAGSLLGTQTVFATTFFSSSRLNFAANLAPSVLVCVTVPFVIYDHPIPVALILLCVLQNVTAAMTSRANRMHVMEEVLRIQSEMEAEREASLAKSQFIATMSHELRTPLNAVIGYAEILEEELSEDGRKTNAEDAARISRAAHNLLNLINGILDYSKVEAGRMDVHVDEVDVRDLLQDVVHTVSHLTIANATAVEIDIARDAASIRSDAQRLRQCLLNLVSNAAKFTEAGRIRVRAAMEETAEARLLRIDVSDTGCGISEADAARLFQPFSQVDGSLTRKQDGTGLGLVITQQFARLLGGDVSFVSAPGKGSTFTLRVRDHASEAAPASSEAAPVALAS